MTAVTMSGPVLCAFMTSVVADLGLWIMLCPLVFRPEVGPNVESRLAWLVAVFPASSNMLRRCVWIKE